MNHQGQTTFGNAEIGHSDSANRGGSLRKSKSVQELRDDERARIKFSDGSVKFFPRYCLLSSLFPSEGEGLDEIMAVRINGIVSSLNNRLPFKSCTITPVYRREVEGHSIYRRSLVFLLCAAASRVFDKNYMVYVDHYCGSGYACHVKKNHEYYEISEEELSKIRSTMKTMVENDETIYEDNMTYEEAVEYFQTTHCQATLNQIVTNNQPEMRVCCMGKYKALYSRTLVKSTSCLGVFDLCLVSRGFILGYPMPRVSNGQVSTENGEKKDGSVSPQVYQSLTPLPSSFTSRSAVDITSVTPIRENKVMTKVFLEEAERAILLEVSCIGDLNKKIFANESSHFIQLCEAIHNQKIVEISNTIIEHVDTVKIILIAGPSASGKTTFAAKLSNQLSVSGLDPIILTVDNYFVPREQTPINPETGKYDFECVEAVRTELLGEHLNKLVNGEVVKTPMFDFISGKPIEEKITYQLSKKGVIIMEGIHCLNPKLTPNVSAEKTFKIFVAPLTTMKMDEQNFYSNTIGRLFRRIVRDYQTRGYSAKETLARWESVSAGEDKNIFPYMSNANCVFNTSLDYEASVLKTYVSPLLKSVEPSHQEYYLARNLLNILDMFLLIPPNDVPPTSLLREFIGNSFFEE